MFEFGCNVGIWCFPEYYNYAEPLEYLHKEIGNRHQLFTKSPKNHNPQVKVLLDPSGTLQES